MPFYDLDRMTLAARRNGRVRLAAGVVAGGTWLTCLIFGGLWGLLLGGLPSAILALAVIGIVGLEKVAP